MPPVAWNVEPVVVVNDFARSRGQEKYGGLLLHGVWAVDSLHYLAEIDARDDLSQDLIEGFPADRTDVAHVRWATSTCVTSLDLCAAAFGRILCGYRGRRELSVAGFTPLSKPSQADTWRAQLPPEALKWIDDTLADDGYQKVKATRNVLTHGMIRRHFTMPRQRLDIQVDDTRLSVPALVAISRDTAERRIRALLALLPSL